MSILSGKSVDQPPDKANAEDSSALPVPATSDPPSRGKLPAVGKGRKKRRAHREIEGLRQRVLATEPRRSNRNDAVVVALVGRTRGEGVSTVALALARSFEGNGDGRVLLIDADPTGNDLAKKASRTSVFRRGAAGTRVSVIEKAEDMNLVDDVQPIPEWEVDLLAVAEGARSGPGGPLLEGPQWGDYLSAMRARYDVIVVDAGSLEEGALRLWSGVASQILLVVDTTRTTVQALERLGKDLKDGNQGLTGVVLNKRDFPIPQFLY